MEGNFNGMELEELLKLSKMQSEHIKTNEAVFNKNMEMVLSAAPAEQKAIIERTRAITNKAIALAKKGNQVEAENTLNELRNEFKNIK